MTGFTLKGTDPLNYLTPFFYTDPLLLQDLAIALRVSANELVFGESGRALPEDLHHHFEAVSQMTEEDQKTIESIIEGMIAKYQTRAMVSNFKN